MNTRPVPVLAASLLLLSLSAKAQDSTNTTKPATRPSQNAAESGKESRPSPSKYLLDVQEYDISRHKINLNVDGVALVDIYSTLHIAVDRDAIRARAVQDAPGADVDSSLIRLRSLLTIAEEGVARLDQLVADYKKVRTAGLPKESLQRQNEAARGFALNALRSAKTYPALYKSIDAALTGDALQQMRTIFDSTEAFTHRLAAGRIDSLVAAQHLFIQISAELQSSSGTREVHLQGFDSVKARPAFDPPRWSVALSPDQVAELKRDAQAASDIQKGDYGQAIQSLSGVSTTALKDAATSATTCLNGVVADAQKLVTPPDAFTKALQGVNDLKAKLKALADKYGTTQASTDAATLLTGSASDLNDLITLIGNLNQDLKDLASAGAAVVGADKAAATTVATNANACVSQLVAATKPLTDLAQGIKDLLGPAHIAGDVQAIAERALRLDANAIPQSTQLALRTDVGERAAGDQLYIHVRAGQGTGPATTELETREFVIGHAVPYFQTTAGLIFARPTRTITLPSTSGAPVTQFFPAAAYSVLLKPLFGSLARRSGFYSDVLDPGIGLNLAALDFDHDNNPELGVAAVLSVFRDYVQAGYGYDLQQQRTYWFVGIRLPAPSGTFPVKGGGSP